MVGANLQELSSRLGASIRPRKVGQEIAVEELGMVKTLERCETLSQQFLEALEKLKLRGEKHTWKSFRQAFKAVWGADKINAMLEQLMAARGQLVIDILHVLL